MVEIFGGVVDWFVANMPFLSSVFNTVVTTLSNIWNGVGKPLFDFLRTHISNIINVLKPIITSLGSVFSGAFNVIKGAWDFLSPIFDVIVSVISKLANAASTNMSKFSSAITKAMNAVLKPIQWVTDKLSSLMGWLGDVGSKVGGFVSKITGAFRSTDNEFNYSGSIDNNISTKGFNEVALSGQYYQSKTRASESLDTTFKDLSFKTSKTQSGNNDLNKEKFENLFEKMIDLLSMQNELLESNETNISLQVDNDNLTNNVIKGISKIKSSRKILSGRGKLKYV